MKLNSDIGQKHMGIYGVKSLTGGCMKNNRQQNVQF